MQKPYRAIACCIDRDEMTGAVLAEGVRLADGDFSRLRIVHVVAPPRAVVSGPFAYVTPLWEEVEDARAWVADVAATLPGAEPLVLSGPPVRAVTEWVEREGIEIIVAAASRGRVERTLLGGFASHLAYHAPCPVLFVHPRGGETSSSAAGVASAEA